MEDFTRRFYTLSYTNTSKKAVYNRKRQIPGEVSAFLILEKSLYSHSMDAGGLVLTSYSTRLIPETSFRMRLEASRSRS